MSRYLSPTLTSLNPYTPGEQPQDRSYIKLNTNESPYPPATAVVEAIQAETGRLQLYPDPACTALRPVLRHRPRRGDGGGRQR